MKTDVKKQIVEKLESYLQQHNMSAAAFSKKIGINPSVISNLRNGKTTINVGDNKEVVIADKYYETIARAIGFQLQKSYWDVVPTPEMARILATLEDAKAFGYTNVIIGDTGCGKSYISNLFAAKHPMDCFIITIGSSDNLGDILDKIIDALKISSEKTKSKKIKSIAKHLKDMQLNGYKPLLIFDESEYMKQPALCALKELYDNLNGTCGIIMLGTDQLLRNLDKLRKKNKEGIPQFYRRIKFGIRRLPAIDKTFKLFLTTIEDKSLVKFLQIHCENYGELHDVLMPALREADRTGEPLTERFVRTMLNMPIN